MCVPCDGKRGNTDSINASGSLSIKNDVPKQYILRFAPKSDSTIMPITINLSEYFTSSRLSLNSHEGRLGNHGAEQLFNSMLHASTKGYIHFHLTFSFTFFFFQNAI